MFDFRLHSGSSLAVGVVVGSLTVLPFGYSIHSELTIHNASNENIDFMTMASSSDFGITPFVMVIT